MKELLNFNHNNIIIKTKFLFIILLVLEISCKEYKHSGLITGSWYSVNKDSGLYEEIHINDSLLIYCNSWGIIIPYNYIICNDSLFIFYVKNEIINKYKISSINEKTNQLILINGNEKFLFIRMDTTFFCLDSIFYNETKLDTFSYNFFLRSRKKL